MRSSVIFVCTGNICRSPTAEGIFMKMVADAGLLERIGVDSAGTHGYHVGEAPDPRAQAAAARRGYDLSRLRARKFQPEDFQRFDLVLAMDRDNYEILSQLAQAPTIHRLQMMMKYASKFQAIDVPDPYYGGRDGFDHVLDMLEDAAKGLLARLLARSTEERG